MLNIGDLVKASYTEECYEIAFGCSKITQERNPGIVMDFNSIKYFVLWRNGELKAYSEGQLEVISESR